MTTPQADHYAAATLALDFVAAARRELADAYSTRSHDRAKIADLHQAIGVDLKLADVHATLALRDAIARTTAPRVPLTGDHRG